MKNKTLDLIIENYKNQLFQLMQVDYLTSEQRTEANNLIEALSDLTNARVIYERFYAAN
jgi:DNA-binding transcriptional regulator PaaX